MADWTNAFLFQMPFWSRTQILLTGPEKPAHAGPFCNHWLNLQTAQGQIEIFYENSPEGPILSLANAEAPACC